MEEKTVFDRDLFEEFDSKVMPWIGGLSVEETIKLLELTDAKSPEQTIKTTVARLKQINEELNDQLTDFGWIHPERKIRHAEGIKIRGNRQKGFARPTLKIIYVFRELTKTLGEDTAIIQLIPTLEALFERHSRRSKAS